MTHITDKKKSIIMIGPDSEGLGGVSRVIKIWEANKIFEEHNIKYISTVANSTNFFKLFDLTRSILRFIFLSIKNCRGTYIHTASRNSFYRKMIFITISIIFSKKIILHIHPTFFYTFIMNLEGIRKFYAFYLLRKIHSYVVLTKKMEDDIRRLFPQKRIYVLRNPINFEIMKNNNGIIRGKNSLLFLGWYVKVKGVFDLIDAVQLIIDQGRDVKLEMYGAHNKKILESYVEQKNLLNNVRVNSWIDDNEKLKALYSSTILILPSYSEGIPNVILEAMATNTPIVATAVGGLKEILADHNNALIAKVKNPVDLSKKILELLKNQDLRHRISNNAYKLAEKEFNITIIKQKFDNIIKREFS